MSDEKIKLAFIFIFFPISDYTKNTLYDEIC